MASSLGILNYLAPDSRVNRRYVAPGEEFNTGRYVAHHIQIHDARADRADFRLDVQGFALLDDRWPGGDPAEAAKVPGPHMAAMEALVARETGADLVLGFGTQLRRAQGLAEGYQPPAADVHVDYWPERAAPMCDAMLRMAGREEVRWRRAMAINLWRVLTPPPQDYPLALCDARSVRDEEGVRNLMIRVDTLPPRDAIPEAEPDDPTLPAASVFPWSAAHRWYYFSGMTPDELLIFKLWDSARGEGWRVPHTAFHDRQAAAPVPRESLEYRLIAYWT